MRPSNSHERPTSSPSRGERLLAYLFAILIFVLGLFGHLPEAHQALHARQQSTCLDDTRAPSGAHASPSDHDASSHTHTDADDHGCAVALLSAGVPLGLSPEFVRAPVFVANPSRLAPDWVAPVRTERLHPPGRAPPARG